MRLGKPKLKEREEAINLREQGWSYREILEKVPVAKSTLSAWLGSVCLTKKQKQRLTEKSLAAGRRGAAKRKSDRIALTKKIVVKARDEVGRLSRRERWLIGAALYWAEGSKAKEKYPAVGVIFSNSDPIMLSIFKNWLISAAKVKESEIRYELYVHESHKGRLLNVRQYWSKKLSVPVSSVRTVYFKKNKIATNRKKVDNEYYGLIRIRVSASSALNRSITGWIEGIGKNWGIV